MSSPGNAPAPTERGGSAAPTDRASREVAGQTEKRSRRAVGRRAERSSLMNVGRRVDYALRALAYLAGQPTDRVIPRAEIESQQGIPRHFLSKILRRLVAAELLVSLPGARGGFRLCRPASEVTVREVYECFEGALCLIECVPEGDSFCCFAKVCTQIDVWQGAQRRLLEYLDGVSVAAIADQQGLMRRLANSETPRG